MDSDDDLSFSPPTEGYLNQKKIQVGRMTGGNQYLTNRNSKFKSLNKSDIGIRSLQNKNNEN